MVSAIGSRGPYSAESVLLMSLTISAGGESKVASETGKLPPSSALSQLLRRRLQGVDEPGCIPRIHERCQCRVVQQRRDLVVVRILQIGDGGLDALGHPVDQRGQDVGTS